MYIRFARSLLLGNAALAVCGFRGASARIGHEEGKELFVDFFEPEKEPSEIGKKQEDEDLFEEDSGRKRNLKGYSHPEFLETQTFTSKCKEMGFSDWTLEQTLAEAGFMMKDIFIIGGGMSGLTAAFTIEQEGSKTYVLAEPREKLGGAMQKFDFPHKDVAFEDGPNWIGGDWNNPMFALANEYGLEIFPQNFYNQKSFKFKSGEVIPRKTWRRRFNRYLNNAYECLNNASLSFAQNFSPGDPVPSLEETLENECGYKPEKPFRDIDEWVLWQNIDYTDGGSPPGSALTTWPIYTYNELFNENQLSFEYTEYYVADKRGYQHIPEQYALEKLDNTNIKKEVEVCRVFYDDDGATVLTSEGIAYNVSKVITTINPSLYIDQDIFVPPLITEDDFPFIPGHYQKVYFTFHKNFWDKRQFLNVVYRPKRRGECGWFQNLDFGYRPRRFKNFYPGLVNVTNVKGVIWPGSHTLMCIIATEAVERVMGNEDDVIGFEEALKFLKPLKRIYKHKYVHPKQIYLPRWRKDPCMGRLLVGVLPGFGPDKVDAFLQAGQPTVHVSGTQACRRWAGWTHGAYGAGILTANNVLEQLGCEVTNYTECDI